MFNSMYLMVLIVDSCVVTFGSCSVREVGILGGKLDMMLGVTP